MGPTDKLIPNPKETIRSPEAVAPWVDRCMDYWLAGMGPRFSAEMQIDVPLWHYTGEYEAIIIEDWDGLEDENLPGDNVYAVAVGADDDFEMECWENWE